LVTHGSIKTDVVIVGAGPAGAAAGLVLATRHRVLLIDRRKDPARRIGDSLIPAARRLLRDMVVLDAFEAEGHLPYLGNRSLWGGTAVAEVDFMRDPEGPGWHLDRPRFERFLRATAVQRGACFAAPARLSHVTRDRGEWRLIVETDAGPRDVVARILIDASGRGASVAKRVGAVTSSNGRLVASWLHGTTEREDGATAGFSMVESEEDGWWYTSPLPAVHKHGSRVIAFHTDADLLAKCARDPAAVLARARTLPGIGATLDHVGFAPDGPSGTTAAHSAILEPVAGEGWLAIGDAAHSFDPLSSCGLFNALYTAMNGAMACHEVLEGYGADFSAYAVDLVRVRRAYERQLAHHYTAETRWPHSPFWSRRAATHAPARPKTRRRTEFRDRDT